MIQVKALRKIYYGDHLYERGERIDIKDLAGFSDSTINKGFAYGSMELISAPPEILKEIEALREVAKATVARKSTLKKVK